MSAATSATSYTDWLLNDAVIIAIGYALGWWTRKQTHR